MSSSAPILVLFKISSAGDRISSSRMRSSLIVIGSSRRFLMVGSLAGRIADRLTSSPVSSVMILYVILLPICSDIPTHRPRSSLDLPGNDCCDSSSRKYTGCQK